MEKQYRLSFLIYPRVQLPLIGILIVLGAVIAVAINGVVNSAFDILTKDLLAAGVSDSSQSLQLLNYHRDTIVLNLSAMALLSSSVAGVFMIYLSHKFVGPVIRLLIYFRSFKGKPHGPLHFRKGDYFSELPVAINEALDQK